MEASKIVHPVFPRAIPCVLVMSEGITYICEAPYTQHLTDGAVSRRYHFESFTMRPLAGFDRKPNATELRLIAAKLDGFNSRGLGGDASTQVSAYLARFAALVIVKPAPVAMAEAA